MNSTRRREGDDQRGEPQRRRRRRGWACRPSSQRDRGVVDALNASRIVTQLSQAKLPDATSQSWVTTMIAAATAATGCGANKPNGTTSCAKWLPAHLDSVQRLGQAVEEPAQRSGHRLRLVVVVQAGQVAPARVAAHLDQPRAELDPEQQPAGHPERQHRRRDPVVAEEDQQEAGLQQQRLPAERVPGLPDVDDRQVERPTASATSAWPPRAAPRSAAPATIAADSAAPNAGRPPRTGDRSSADGTGWASARTTARPKTAARAAVRVPRCSARNCAAAARNANR